MRESDFVSDDWCAGCGSYIRHARETGVSGLYFPGTKCILLCEPCFLAEDDAIEDAGTNNLPERLSRYLRTLAEAAR
jgi:hypothetical protein